MAGRHVSSLLPYRPSHLKEVSLSNTPAGRLLSPLYCRSRSVKLVSLSMPSGRLLRPIPLRSSESKLVSLANKSVKSVGGRLLSCLLPCRLRYLKLVSL